MSDVDGPPSTLMHAPVRRPACREHTNATTLATSSTVPNLPIGISWRTKSAMPSGSACCRRDYPPPSQRIEPGAPALTATPFDGPPPASDLTKPISAALGGLEGGAPPAPPPPP